MDPTERAVRLLGTQTPGIRVRAWYRGQPLPELDVTTGSQAAALELATARAEMYGSWDDVSVVFPGERAFKGEELRQLVERSERAKA